MERHKQYQAPETPPAVGAYELLHTVATSDAPAVTTGALAEEFEISEQAIRKHVYRLVRADCLHLKETGAGRVYWLTTRGANAVRNGGTFLHRNHLLSYPATSPEPTVDDVELTRREGRSGRLGPFEPLELLQDAHRETRVVSTTELAEGLGLTRGAVLRRLHKLRTLGLVDGVDTGNRVIAWVLTEEGYELLNDPDVDRGEYETRYRNTDG